MERQPDCFIFIYKPEIKEAIGFETFGGEPIGAVGRNLQLGQLTVTSPTKQFFSGPAIRITPTGKIEQIKLSEHDALIWQTSPYP